MKTALLPLDDDTLPFSDSDLPRGMIEAGIAVLEQADHDLRNYIPTKTIDWDYGMEAVAVYRAMTKWAQEHGPATEGK